MLGQNRVTPSIKFPRTHFKLGWREDKNTTRCPQPLLYLDTRSGGKHTNHEATTPPEIIKRVVIFCLVFAWKKHVEINAHISLVRGCISGNTQRSSLMDDTSNILKAKWKEFPTVSLWEWINWLMCDFIPRTLPRFLLGWISIAV